MDFAGIAAVVSKTASVAAVKVLDFVVADSRPCHLPETSLELIMTALIVYAPLTALLAVRMLPMQKVLYPGVMPSCSEPLVTKMFLGVRWFAAWQNSYPYVVLYQTPLLTFVPELELRPAASIVLDAEQLPQDHSLPLPQFHL